MTQIVRQHLDGKIGCEHPRADPGEHHGGANDPEDAAGVFARGGLGKAHRHEGGDGDQGAGQTGHGGRLIGVGGGLDLVPARFHLHDHHLQGDDGVVHQQAQGDDERPQRDPLQIPAHSQHDDGDHAQHQGDRQGDHQARAPAQAQQAHDHHDHQGFHQCALEVPDRLLDSGWLVGDQLKIQAVGQFILDLGDARLERLAELDYVAIVGHHHPQHQHLLAVVADAVGLGILIALMDCGEVAELDHPATGGNGQVANVVEVTELAADAHIDTVRGGIEGACRQDGVLALQGRHDLRWLDAQRRQAFVGELDVNFFRLLAEQIDLVDHGHLEQVALDDLRLIGEIREADPVALDGVYQAVDVTELVVEDGPHDAVRQLELEIGELLARLVPGLLLVRLGGPPLHADRHAAKALTGEGHHLFEVI
ncbi:hypothetical protein D3C71_1014820 [compost metagenome]